MNKAPLSLILALGFLLGATKSEAQLYFWNTAVTNGQWNDVANWQDGVVPNEAGALVYFDNTNPTVGLNGYSATAGEINIASGAVLGSTTNSDDFINLDSASAAQPLISVAAGNAFMYAEVTGTNGFRKSGAGRLSFRFNPNNQAYTGSVTLSGGTLGLNQDGSLGDTNNDLVVEATGTLQIEPGNNTNPVALAASRSISIAAGTSLTINNSDSRIVTTVNGPITGDGSLTFGGTGTLVLAAGNAYLGTTTINGPGFGGSGTNTNIVGRTNLVSFAGAGSLPVTNPLVFSFGTAAATNSSSVLGVNLGGAAATPATLTIGNSTSTASTNSLMAFDITNGSLTYSNATALFGFSARGAGSVTNELRLPDAATLSFSNISIGVLGAGSNAMLSSRILVGSNATLNANLFTMGAYRASGSIEARAAGASLKMRATDGSSAVPQILVGNFAGGPNPVASINLSNGSVDIVATEIVVARNIANNSTANGSVSFSNGTLTATSLVVGNAANAGSANVATTNTNVVVGTVTQNGGIATISNIVLGRSGAQGTTNGPVLDRYSSTYTLNGGTLATALVNTDSTNTAISGMTRTFNLNGGTLRGLDATSDLSVTATTNSFAAIGFVAGTTNAKTISVDAGRNVNFSAGVEFQANGGTTTFALSSNSVATLAGRFRVGVSGTNDAEVRVTNGTVNLSSTTAILGIGDRTNGSSTLTITGGTVNIGLTNNRMLVGGKFNSTVNVSGGSLNVSGNQPVYIGGDISFGANNALGTWTVSAGSVTVGGSAALVLGQNSTNTNGVITTNSAGVLNLNGGNFTTTRAITAGTNGASTGTVNFNGGTLAAGTNVANLIAVTTATVASNTTIDTGTFDSGIGQNLLGSGILTVSGTGTLRLNGSNSTPVVVNSGATLGGTGTAGSMVVNGTVAPGLAGTNGTLTSTASVTVPGAARFRLFANGSNDRLVASGTVNLSGGSVAVTNNYALTNGDSFDLIDGTISGSPTLSLPTLDAGLVWVTNDFTSSGVLSVTNGSTPTNNYDSWVAFWQTNSGGSFTNTGGTSDPDGDGFVNNLEFAFDGNPTVGTPALMTVTPAGTNAVFNWVQRLTGASYEVQKNTTLTNAWGPAVVTISNSANTNGILIPADYLRKEFVVPASGKDFYRVQATITNN